MANYANTYSIKLDKSDFDSKLNALSTAYKSATSAMETQSINLKRAKQNLANIEKAKNAELEKGILTSVQVNKQFREELALAKSAVAYENQKLRAHKQNHINIQQQIANTKELSRAEYELGNATKSALQAQKNATIGLKDKYGVTSKAEIVARKYAQSLKEVNEAEKKGLITSREAVLARKNLNSARKQDLATTKESIAYRNTAINGVVRHIRKIESLVVAFYGLKKSYDYTLGLGHEFNKMMESEQIGIALAITQKLKDVDVTGKQVSALDKWIYANKLARKEMEEVRKINVFTPHTLGQTVQLYKVISGQVRANDGTSEDALRITKQLSILAQAGNVEFKSMLKTVDQLFSGKMKASDMQIALQNIVGLTQEGTREALREGKALEYVSEKLKGVEIASLEVSKTWGGVTSNFTNAWTDIFATLQKPMFEAFKSEMNEATVYLIENKETIIEGFEEFGRAIKFTYGYLDEFIVAFSTFKAINFVNGIVLAQKEMMVYDVNTKRAVLSTRALAVASTALRTVFTPVNIAVGALTLAYSLYNDAQEETAKLEAEVDKSMRRTKESIEQLDIAYVKVSKRTLGAKLKEDAEGIDDLEKRIQEVREGINKGRYATSSFFSTENIYSEKNLELMEASLVTRKKEKEEHKKQLELYEDRLKSEKEGVNEIDFAKQKTIEFTDEIYKSVKASEKLSQSLRDVVLEFNKTVRAGQVVDGVISSSEAKIQNAQEAYDSAVKARREARAGLTAIGETSGGGADKTNAIKEQSVKLQKAITNEYKALNDLKKLGTEISLNELEVDKTKLLLSAKDEELLRRKNKDKIATIDYTYAKAKIEKDDALRKLAVNEKGLSLAEQEIEKARILQEYKEAGIEREEAILALNTKTGKASDKLLKNTSDLTEKYLQITGQIDLLEAFKIKETVAEFEKAGYSADKLLKVKEGLKEADQRAFDKKFALEAPTSVEEVFNPYLNMIESQKEYIKNIKEAGKNQAKIDKINAKQVELRLKGYAGLANGMKGLFKEGTKGYKTLDTAQRILQASEMAWFIKKQFFEKEGLATKLSALATGTTASVASSQAEGASATAPAVAKAGAQGGLYGSLAMVALLAGLGLMVGGSGGTSNDFAEKNVGLSTSDIKDESLDNIAQILQDVQYPMLEVTNKMFKHIRNMDNNFYSIARAISGTASVSGVDLTGASFSSGIYEGNLYSTKTKDLLGAGLKFAEQSLQDMADMDKLYVKGYEYAKTTKEYAWKTSVTYNTTLSELPAGTRESFADAFANGYEMLFESGVLLGLDKADLTKALNDATIKLGDAEGKINLEGLDAQGVADALDDIFSTAFSQVVNQIGDFKVLVDRYSSGMEESLETLLRISIEYEQASFSFDLIGKTFTDGIMTVTKSWTEESVVAVANAITDTTSSFFGAQTAFTRGMTSFGSIFGTAVNTVTETVTKTFTESVQDVYTAQMQILDIVESAGGLESFQDAMSSYMSGFYTESEQLEFMTKSMQTSFNNLGVEMPKTNAEFRKLMETMDTSTEEGAYLYGQILLLADSFNNMTEASKSLGTSMEDMIQNVADAWMSNLSYLTLQQKADYATGLLALSRQTDGIIDEVEVAKLRAETALKTTATKEEYIPIFEDLVTAMENEVPDATRTDLLLELRNLKTEVIELQNKIDDNTIYGGTA